MVYRQKPMIMNVSAGHQSIGQRLCFREGEICFAGTVTLPGIAHGARTIRAASAKHSFESDLGQRETRSKMIENASVGADVMKN